jgi:hypothetical protein
MLMLATGVLISVLGSAQNGRLSVEVKNDQNLGLEAVTIELLKVKDSTIAKTALTDKGGLAEIENIGPGEYFVKATMVNYATGFSDAFVIDDTKLNVSLPSIRLNPGATSLAGVTVTARKPFIQKLTDRIVVNVENSIVSAGSSAIDVLERSPGVLIDNNDVISLRGRAGVIIMIDGKPSAMSGADLANYLRGLPSAAIERIEIITNPSAKYDAAGNSGIIDIRMKKDQRFGTNGTFTAGYGQGIYPKANAGSTLNYRNKKINIFGNYNYAYREGLNHLILDRNFYNNGVYSGGDLKDNYSKFGFSSNAARLGMDFFPSANTILGFVVNGNFNGIDRHSDNNSKVINSSHQQVSTFTSIATNDDHNENFVVNVNFKHRFDSVGKELTADMDYGNYSSNSLSRNSTQYFKMDGSQLQPNYTLDGDQEGDLSFKTAKADYVNPMKNGGRFEMGMKISVVKADNDAKFFDMSNGTAAVDVNKTNHFIYKEKNNAGYLNYSSDLKKISFQLGLRGEQTIVSTHQRMGDVHFDSSYFQLFPSAFFNYKISDEKVLGVSVSRRIDRPGYGQLNPFLFLIDPTTYATGRPGLLPQLTWSYELTYTLKSLNFTLGYSHTTNNQNIAIARFRDVFPTIPSDENVTVQIPINLESSDYFGLSVSAPVKINNWWNMINNINVYYNHFNGELGGTTLDNGKPVADIRTNNSFTLKKGWAAELNANYSSGGQYGFMVSDPQWGIAAGVQKIILKNRGVLRFNISDIFWTNLPKAVITYNNYIEKWHAFRETRVANLTFSYRFGSNKVQGSRKRTTASEEERQRAGN